jgi:hypothetical protein
MKALLFLLLTSCTPVSVCNFYHDAQNPCTPGQMSYNKRECERWQQMEPKQYEKYLTRLKNYHDSKIGNCKNVRR